MDRDDLRILARPFKQAELFTLILITLAFGGGSIGAILQQRAPTQAPDVALAIATTQGLQGLRFASEADPRILQAHFVSAEFFKTAGVDALLGRVLTADDERVGADPVVVLSYELWSSLSTEDNALIGDRMVISGIEVTVIGVMPATFSSLDRADLWLPAQLGQKTIGGAGRWM